MTHNDAPPKDAVPNDLTGLAAEALALWQAHLATLADNPQAKAEMAAWLEPSRRLFASSFAEWTAMMQNVAHAPNTANPYSSTPSSTGPGMPSGAAAPAAASDDSALRLAQLACRVAELEKRLSQLEAKQERRASAKTAKSSGRKSFPSGT